MKRLLVPCTRRNISDLSLNKSMVQMNSRMELSALSNLNNALFPTKAQTQHISVRTRPGLLSIMAQIQLRSKPNFRSLRTLRSIQYPNNRALNRLFQMSHHPVITQTLTRFRPSRRLREMVPTQCQDKRESLTSANSRLFTQISSVRDTTEKIEQ